MKWTGEGGSTSAQDTQSKKAVSICTCSGISPSMWKIDFWALAERVRLEPGDRMEFIVLHPRLCEEDGERLMARVLSDDTVLVTRAGAEKKQRKLLRDGFQKAGVPTDAAHWIPVSMAQGDTGGVAVLRGSACRYGRRRDRRAFLYKVSMII